MHAQSVKLKLVTRDGQMVGLTSPRTSVGRSEDNMVHVDSPYMSRHHIEIIFDGRAYGVVDLGSAHGTMLNGKRLMPQRTYALQAGDLLTLANEPFFVVQSKATPSIPAWSMPKAGDQLAAAAMANLRMLSGQVDTVLAGVGAFIVVVSFFLGWFNASSPAANVYLEGLVTLDFSGLTFVLGFPDLGIPGSPLPLLIPLLALITLALSILRRSIRQMAAPIWALVQSGLASLGVIYMFFQLIGTRYVWGRLMQEAGLPSVLGDKLFRFRPVIGFWTTCLGFILILAAGLWIWRKRPSPSYPFR
jgi:hypothetical protein